MELRLERQPHGGNAVPGVLVIDGAPWCFTLERADVMIPCGRYRVVVTVSGRAQQGTLWCPAADEPHVSPNQYVLPELLLVPGRSAIRIHALNTIEQTEGCIGVGLTRAGDEIHESREALRHLMGMMKDAREVWIDVVDAA